MSCGMCAMASRSARHVGLTHVACHVALMWQWNSQFPTRSGTQRIFIVAPGSMAWVVTSRRLSWS